MKDSIVVTGLGFVSPLGTGTEEVWQAWSSQVSGIRELLAEDPRLARGVDPVRLRETPWAGYVRGFRPREHIQSKHLRRMDWCSRMVVASATQAAADAGLALESEEAQVRTAMVVGSTWGNQRETQQYLGRVLRSGPKSGQPLIFPNLVLNAAAGYAAIELSVRGPNLSVSDHEVSGEIAVATAVDLLEAGLCDRVIVAGVDEFCDIYLDGLLERRLLDPRCFPEKARPDAQRARVVPGEGAAALVLEYAATARKRGRVPHAALRTARSGGMPSQPYLPPDPGAAAKRLLGMLDSTKDPSEAAAPIDALLGGGAGSAPRQAFDRALVDELAQRQTLAPTLIQIDHLVGDWGARGALATALASLAIQRKEIPRTAETTGSGSTRILIPGFGRSGALVPIVLEKANPEPP